MERYTFWSNSLPLSSGPRWCLAGIGVVYPLHSCIPNFFRLSLRYLSVWLRSSQSEVISYCLDLIAKYAQVCFLESICFLFKGDKLTETLWCGNGNKNVFSALTQRSTISSTQTRLGKNGETGETLQLCQLRSRRIKILCSFLREAGVDGNVPTKRSADPQFSYDFFRKLWHSSCCIYHPLTGSNWHR